MLIFESAAFCSVSDFEPDQQLHTAFTLPSDETACTDPGPLTDAEPTKLVVSVRKRLDYLDCREKLAMEGTDDTLKGQIAKETRGVLEG